jgi:hypothetical protein
MAGYLRPMIHVTWHDPPSAVEPPAAAQALPVERMWRRYADGMKIRIRSVEIAAGTARRAGHVQAVVGSWILTTRGLAVS